MTTPADRIREVIEATGLTIDAFATRIGEKPQRVKDVLRGKQRAPADMLEAIARLPNVDIQYVVTGFRANEVSGVKETAALYDASGPWANNLLGSFDLAATDAMREPLRGVDVAADGAPRVRNALASMVQVYAHVALAKPITPATPDVARTVHVLDEALLRSVMLGVEDFLGAKRARMPADKKVELIVGVYAHFLKQKQTKASRANVLEFIRRAA